MTDPHARHAHRYPIAALVSFSWCSPGGAPQLGEGVTRDISHLGVMVISDASPPVGVSIQMNVRLPRVKGSLHSVTMVGEGSVVRSTRGIDGGEGPPGFATSVQFYLEQSDDTDLLNAQGDTLAASKYRN